MKTEGGEYDGKKQKKDYHRECGEVYPLVRTGKKGIMIVRQGKLSTPMDFTSEDFDFYNDNGNAIIRTDNNRLIAGCRETVIPDDIESVEKCAYENWIDKKNIDLPIVDSLAGDNISDEKETEVDAEEGNYMTRNYMTGAVVLPDTVKIVAKNTFKDCSIEELIIPEGVETIEDDAFNACKKLTRITLPESLKKIGRNAFSHCGIKSLEVPDGVKKIGSGAFEGISHIEYKGTAAYKKDSRYWGAKSMN